MSFFRRTPDHWPDDDFEPYEEHYGVPLPVLWIAIALAIWGALMLYQTSQDTIFAREERAEEKVEEVGTLRGDGHDLFLANCSTCHQANGLGIRGAVPPLAGSEFVGTGPDTVARILLRGIDGPIAVEGRRFDGHMPSFASVLPDGEIRQIANYVTTTFGAGSGDISVDDVAKLRLASEGQNSFRGGKEIADIVAGLPAQPPVPVSGASEGTLDPAISSLVFEGRGTAWACASCHGEIAQGTENVPRLAGLPANYIAGQLADFKSGDRHDGSMQLVAKSLSEDEMEKLGAYFATLRVPSNARPSLGANLARGEQLALHGDWTIGVPACFTCHGPSGFGVAPNFPALAAQHAPYIATQLAGWEGGRRPNSPLGLMQKISKALRTEDRRAVADYLASLPPVPAGSDATARLESGNAE